MKRPSVYSGRNRTPVRDAPPGNTGSAPGPAGSPEPKVPPGKLRALLRRYERPLLFGAGLASATLVAALLWFHQPQSREYTQEDIDAAVMHTFETKTLPSQAARAAESVRQSVVRVNGYSDVPVDEEEDDHEKDKDSKGGGGDRKHGDESGAKKEQKDQKNAGEKGKDKSESASGKGKADDKLAKKSDGKGTPARNPKLEKGDDRDSKSAAIPKKGTDASKGADALQAAKPGETEGPKMVEKRTRVGTGVVIVDNGTILTNLHVVAGAKRVTVTFSDGMESEAVFVGGQPENDLAVIRAKQIPDDLPAATLGSSDDLQPGDGVVAVGFPFGIGPSVSAGVVSGLNREFNSPEGKRKLRRLIQFDAAVNPGNSGGPLLNMSGEVVGIVTALLNPTEHHTFIGIGFAATIESAGSAVGVPPF